MISCWISRFEVPAKITSNCVAQPQCTSSLWAVLCSLLNISCMQMTSFHPQSKGLVECFHCSLKTSCHAHLAGPDWFDHLPLVMLGLRTTPRDETGLSASEAVYGAPFCLPGEFHDSVDLPPREFVRGLTLPSPHQVASPSAHVPAALASAESCLIARTPQYSLSLNSTLAPTEFSVARTSFCPWKLVPSKILLPLND